MEAAQTLFRRRSRLWPWALFAAATLASAQGAPLAPIAVEHFFQYPAVLDAELSPSGKQLALTTSRGGERVGLVVIELGDKPKVEQTARFDDGDVVSFQWVNDQRLIFSVLDLVTGSAEDRRTGPGLMSIDPDGSHLRVLIARKGYWRLAEYSKRAAPPLDNQHQLLHVPTNASAAAQDEVIVGRWGTTSGAGTTLQPMWLNVRTGRTRHIDADAPADTYAWYFDSHGTPRVALTRSGSQAGVHWRGPGQTQWQPLWEGEALREPFYVVGTDDAGTLYIAHPEGPDGHAVLSRFDFRTMAPQAQPMLRVQGFDFAGRLVRESTGGRVLGARVHGEDEFTAWLDPAMAATQAMIDAHLPGRVNSATCRRCGQPDMVVLVRSYSDRDPGHLWLYRADTQRWQSITRVLDGIDPRRMAGMELHRVRARDGRELPVWLTRPAGQQDGQPAPTVVLVHGGPWVRGGYWGWHAMEQFLASRGYLVISPEFRGSTGYGEAHFRAGWKQWGQAMQDDVADALLWAQKSGLASQRACIAGASFGGYAALMGLVRHPELYRCGVAWAALTDPFLFLQGSWWVDDDISDVARTYDLRLLVGDAERDATMLTTNSPLAQAARIRAPLLLGFGEGDQRVPIQHGERLREALTGAGRPPEWVSYPYEGHAWRKIETQVDWARRVEQFLARHLGAD